MYEICYYQEKAKLYYMDAESFIESIETDHIYVIIVKDVETRSDSSNYKLDKSLRREKSKNVIGLTKEE